MMRMIRCLLGTSRREIEAERLMDEHRSQHQHGQRNVEQKVAALQKLVGQLKRDTEKWQN